MLTELCQYLKNWEFDGEPVKYIGKFNITGGVINSVSDNSVYEALPITTNQYIRVIGSKFNDGVWKYPDNHMTDEDFEGAVWALFIPPSIVALAQDIAAWRAKFEDATGSAMSPFASESFAGYSYSKGAGAPGMSSGNGLSGWQAAFANRLSPWRKN